MSGILLTGGTGLLATNWALCIRNSVEVTLGLHRRTISLAGTKSILMDLSSEKSLYKLIDDIEPEIVIHTAGMTSIEDCEANPDSAFHINVELASNVAMVCEHSGVKMVHISTDNLYGQQEQAATESDPLSPVNVYGKTKAMAEQYVLDRCSDALVIRTNFYGWGTSYRSSFSDTVLNTLQDNDKLNLFSDVQYTPILVEVLVTTVHELIDLNQTGIFNVSSDESLSKYDFGLKIAEVFNMDKSHIKPISIKDLKNLVTRPVMMRLNNEKVRHILGRSLGNVDNHLYLLKRQQQAGVSEELGKL